MLSISPTFSPHQRLSCSSRPRKQEFNLTCSRAFNLSTTNKKKKEPIPFLCLSLSLLTPFKTGPPLPSLVQYSVQL